MRQVRRLFISPAKFPILDKNVIMPRKSLPDRTDEINDSLSYNIGRNIYPYSFSFLPILYQIPFFPYSRRPRQIRREQRRHTTAISWYKTRTPLSGMAGRADSKLQRRRVPSAKRKRILQCRRLS